MREIWVQTNRRILALAFLVPLALVGLGLPLIIFLPLRHPANWLGVAALALAALIIAALVQLWRQPRLAYEDGELLVYLQPGPPERVPIEHVECFFIGEAPSMLPPAEPHRGGKARAILVRLAERATQYHARPAKPQLGLWQDGYITIRGTWCEPIEPPLLQDLNARLVAAHRSRRGDASE